MRDLYLDLFSGISGDMFLGLLVDLGAPVEALRETIGRLGIEGWQITAEASAKGAIGGTKVTVTCRDETHERHLPEIEEIIRGSSLGEAVKERAVAVFRRLAEAEGRVHRIDPEEVHFHEVGALDAIVDVVGTVAGLELLSVDRIMCSPVSLGHGFVECSHGRIPLPAPAVLELLKGFACRQVPVEGELTTPTGAALVTTLATPVPGLPPFELERVGYGLGQSDFSIPNVARGLLGQRVEGIVDRVVQMEANIDDTTPELLGHLYRVAQDAGALDVYLTPIQMKKGRPGIKVSILAPAGTEETMAGVLFRETTTLGVRHTLLERRVLPRQEIDVPTRFGTLRAKRAGHHVAPEYEDCAAAAVRHGVPLREVYEEVKARALAKV